MVLWALRHWCQFDRLAIELHIQGSREWRQFWVAHGAGVWCVLTLHIWSRLSYLLVLCSQGPPARWRDFHSATMIGTKMFVFGGRADRFGPFHSNNEIYCNKIKVFDTETNIWLTAPSTQVSPEGRRSHSACKGLMQLQSISEMGKNLNKVCLIIFNYALIYIHSCLPWPS